MKNLTRNGIDVEEKAAKWFSDLLWNAFPADSEAQVAMKAAKALEVSEKQVRNWLRHSNSPAWKFVFKALIAEGVEIVAQKIEGNDDD